MNWPPVKAWTSKNVIEGQRHFVAINYGGKLLERWVVLMSVIDSYVIVKVSWSQLVDPSSWECGWDDNNYLDSSKLLMSEGEERITSYINLSVDSGLMIPITKDFIRPWFAEN